MNNFIPNVIFEIGVGNPSICRSVPHMNTAYSFPRIEMFEPNPKTYRDLVSAFSRAKNLTIHNVALYDKVGELEFVEDGDSSYISEVKSPTVTFTTKEYINSLNKVKVPTHTLDMYDKGDIDLALIDTEGCEYKIVSKMISRPRVLVLETHNERGYTTPHFAELEQWLADNKYILDHKEITDSIYTLNK